MNPDYILILFAMIPLTWLALIIQSHRLFYSFRSKYPEIARRDIPYAFSLARHPEKFFYFLRSKSIEILRADPKLWPLRQQVKVLSILSLVFPGIFIAFWLVGVSYLLYTKQA